MIQSELNFQESIESLYDYELSDADKQEAASNLAGFLSLLIEIDQST